MSGIKASHAFGFTESQSREKQLIQEKTTMLLLRGL